MSGYLVGIYCILIVYIIIESAFSFYWKKEDINKLNKKDEYKSTS